MLNNKNNYNISIILSLENHIIEGISFSPSSHEDESNSQ